jgi:hypothetical protein
MPTDLHISYLNLQFTHLIFETSTLNNVSFYHVNSPLAKSYVKKADKMKKCPG